MSPTSPLKLCYDRVLTGSQLLQARALAAQERALGSALRSPRPGGMSPGDTGVPPGAPAATPPAVAPRSSVESAPELALPNSTLWKPGRMLRVRFLDGDPAVQARVAAVACQWEQYAGIHFDFGSDPQAEIRISFVHDPGSWSYMGTDALVIPYDQPTMNYGWLGPNTPDSEYRRVVLHEFGHALGCIHEHQNPVADIPWNKPAVYAAYAGGPNYWSQAQVDTNIFNRYAKEITQFSQFDPASIMLYAIPKGLTDGVYEVGWNQDLSATDKAFIGLVYPQQTPGEVQLSIGVGPIPGEISAPGEQDRYHFRVAAAGRFIIETGGTTDVALTLFGPDDPQRRAAHDDDSGQGLNARLRLVLQPGDYILQVRHYRPRGVGKYTVWVRLAN